MTAKNVGKHVRKKKVVKGFKEEGKQTENGREDVKERKESKEVQWRKVENINALVSERKE